MEITLTPEQESFIRHAVESGRSGNAQEAVQQALDHWVERQRNLIDLLNALDEAEYDFANGKYTEYDDQGLLDLAEQIKREGRMRRAAIAS